MGTSRDPQVKAYFLKESQTRGEFARELEMAAGVEKDVGGTASGAVRRYWGELKGSMGGGDHTLLETAEQGEDAAKKAYGEALKKTDMSASVRQILMRQQNHIVSSHNQVKNYLCLSALCENLGRTAPPVQLSAADASGDLCPRL